MKMRIFGAVVAIAFALTACKKNVSEESMMPGTNPMELKAKTWFEAETSKTINSKMPTAGGLAFTGDVPQWNRLTIAANQVIVPVVIGNLSASAGKAAKYLILNTDNKGEVVNGHYTFILGNESNTESMVSSNDIPGDFTGAIIEYSVNGEQISSRHFENGKQNATQDKISTQSLQSRDGGGASTNNVPSCEGGQTVCIEWYWQTYQDGVLIYEEYLYTTCHCEGANTGGGTGTPPGPCGLSCEQVDDLIQNITVTTLHEVTAQGGAEYTDANGVIRMPWADDWKFLKLTLFPGYVPEYKAYFTGVLFRNNTAGSKWKFESFNYNNWAQSGGNTPPCMSVDLTISVSTAIAGDKYTANALLNGVAQTKVPCLNDYKAGRHTITNLPQAFGTPPVLMGED